jgi:D5 N terminal like
VHFADALPRPHCRRCDAQLVNDLQRKHGLCDLHMNGQHRSARFARQDGEPAHLDFARKLGALLNVPLVACPPKLGEEFHYPTGDRDKLSADDNQNQLNRWQPGWAIMGRTGGSVVPVDVDPRNGSDIERTRQLLDGLHVRIFAEVATPSGGRHFYIAGHAALASCSNLDGWPGIDILSYGKLVFLPGTQRPKYNSAGYRIVFDNLEALADGGNPDGAEAFADWVASRRGHGEQFETSSPWQGGEPDARQAQYLVKMLAGIHRDLSAMGKDSGRNTAVYDKALKCGNFIAGAGLDETVATDVLLDASRDNGLVQEDGERSVLASIKSGIRNGKARPRAVPEAKGQVEEVDVLGSVSENTEPEPAQPTQYTATDDGNALRLITEHGHNLRRVADMRRWFVWDGMRWAQDHEDRAIRKAARDLARLLPSGTEAAQRFKRNSMSATGVSSCVRLAETDTRVSILASKLDAHPELLNTPSGVVDLRTGEIRPHDPGLLLTRITAYPVDLDAPHPR